MSFNVECLLRMLHIFICNQTVFVVEVNRPEVIKLFFHV